MNKNLIIESGGFELLPSIEGLWYELKEHHRGKNHEFPDLSTPSFDLRQSRLKEKAKELLVDWVRRQSDNLEIGYCFSTINGNEIGEIESLYVREAFRGQGIGKDLMARALSWMNQKDVTAKRVSVLGWNREAIGFYESFGFRIRVQEMMIPASNDKKAQQSSVCDAVP